MDILINKIKDWFLGLGIAITAVLTLLVLWYKNRSEINEALVKQNKVNKDLEKYDNQIEKNNEALKAEEQKREELKKEPKSEPTSENIVDLFNRRK